MFDMLQGRELRLGLDWERSGEKLLGWEVELFSREEQSMWSLVGGFVS